MTSISRNYSIIARSRDSPNQSLFSFDWTMDPEFPSLGREDPDSKLIVCEVALSAGYIKNYIINIGRRLGNNKVTLNVDNQEYILELPDGMYNIEQFYSALYLFMDNEGLIEPPGEDNGYKESRPIDIVKISGTSSIQITTRDDTSVTLNPPLAEMLGSAEVIPSSSRIITECDMKTGRVIHIKFNNATSSIINGNRSNIIASYLPSRYYGEYQNISPLTLTYLPLNGNAIKTIDIGLYFEDNSIVVFQEGKEDLVHLTFHVKQRSI